MTSALIYFIRLLIAVLILELTNANNAGTECTRSVCEQERGYIGYRRGSIGRWKIRTPDNRDTTFVLLITAEGGPATNTFLPWLRVTQHKYRYDDQHDIRKGGKRLLVLEDTHQVTISLHRYDLSHFRVDYYVGCKIVEGSDTKIVKKSLYQTEEPPTVTPPLQPYPHPRIAPRHTFFPYNQFSGIPQNVHVPLSVRSRTTGVNRHPPYAPLTPTNPEPTCWIIIPSITEQLERTAEDIYYINHGYYRPIRTRHVDVKRTYVTFQNMTMTNETTLYATDMTTGSSVMSSTGNDMLLIATLNKKEESSISYKSDQSISSLILLDLKCRHQRDCDQAAFTAETKALQQSDVECVEREEKCRFNIGTKDYNCTPPLIPPSLFAHFFDITESDLGNSNCTAFNTFYKSILGTVDSIGAEESNDTFTEDEEGSGSGDQNNIEVERRIFNPEQQKRIQKKLLKCNDYPGYCSKSCGKFRRKGCSKICYLFKVRLNICSFFFPSIFA